MNIKQHRRYAEMFDKSSPPGIQEPYTHPIKLSIQERKDESW